MNRPLLRLLLGSSGAQIVFGLLVFVGVWALNPPADCPVTRMLTTPQCTDDRAGIIVNTAITLAVTLAINLTVAAIWLGRRRAPH